MKNAPKLSFDELIKKMDEKGIKYEIDGVDKTKDFIKNHNNYFRTAAYRKNYIKYQEGPRKGQYIRLDFAFLKELSTIDMHLRFIILKMCLDIEHDLKVSFLTDITNNDSENGYECVKAFLKNNSWILKDIYFKRYSTYVGDLISKNFNFVVDEETRELDCESGFFNGKYRILRLFQLSITIHSSRIFPKCRLILKLFGFCSEKTSQVISIIYIYLSIAELVILK